MNSKRYSGITTLHSSVVHIFSCAINGSYTRVHITILTGLEHEAFVFGISEELMFTEFSDNFSF